MSFVRRKIELTFILGTGYFGTQGETTVTITDGAVTSSSNTATLKGLRIKTHISLIDGPTLGTAQLQVYGLTPSLLNQLSGIAQFAMFQRENKVIISVGDDIKGMSVVFEGQINESFADFMAMPDSILHLSATAGSFYLAKPVEPNSFPGSADVATIIHSLATQMGYALENNGVSVILSTQYLPGTLTDQVRQAIQVANIDGDIDDARQLIWIAPKGAKRSGVIPLISADTGMVGYPTHTGTGLIVKTLFNRDIQIHGTVKIKSELLQANGEWLVVAITHDLESETVGGQWFTNFQGANLDNPHAAVVLK